MQKITEQESHYNQLEKMNTRTILENMNREDRSVPDAIEKVIPVIEKLVDLIVDKMLSGGRLFYIGAGTSGRIAITDASECPPTFGVPFNLVIGIIAGGDKAIRKAVEHAEDNFNGGWEDLKVYQIQSNDVVIGVAASGSTPYVVGALQKCREHKITTACVTCNLETPVAKHADYPIEVIVGPEFITGSTRLKSGTAQKLVLNMISTATMIKLGRVKGNKMVDMQLTNDKLIDRGSKMIADTLEIEYDKAKALLLKAGSVRLAIDNYKK